MSITLDATNWINKNDFYNAYCNETKAPEWFGKNLDALEDSFRGGICEITPEKIIIINLTNENKKYFETEFWKEVESICKDNDVELEIHNN
jgi:RNAse (barnase) inhibitor barstar